MRLLGGFLRAGVVRLTGVLVAAVAVAACCVGVSSAAAGVIRTIPVGSGPSDVSSDGTHVWVTNHGEDTVSEIPTSYTVVPPTVVTGSASSATQTTATLNATANPNGGEVSECTFEYGTTTSYGASVPCISLPGFGESPVAVSASAWSPGGSLSAGTTYHFRIVATNPRGTSYGSDRAFTTLPLAAPEFTTKAAVGSIAGSVAIAGTLGPGYLEGNTTHKKISCTGGHLTGVVTGPKTTTDNVITFTGCTAESGLYKCENTPTEGEVVTNALEGTLENVTATIPAIRLFPEGPGPIVSFACKGHAKIEVSGSLIGALSGASGLTVAENKLAASLKLTFAEAHGLQKYKVFSGQLPFAGDQLTSNIETWNSNISSWGASTELAGQAVAITLVSVPAGNLGVTL